MNNKVMIIATMLTNTLTRLEQTLHMVRNTIKVTKEANQVIIPVHIRCIVSILMLQSMIKKQNISKVKNNTKSILSKEAMTHSSNLA